jgi:hypothetical protein
VSGAGRGCSLMRALTTSTTPARVGIARCSGLGWRWAVATFSGCRHWGRRHPWTRTTPSGRAGPQHQQARPPQRPWRYAGAPDGRVGQPGLPAPLGTNPPRTHPFAPYGRQRPGKTAVRTALSPRYLIRMRPLVQVQPGPQNRPLTSRNAGRLASRCQPDRMHPIGDEVLRGASYPGGGTTRLSSLFTAPLSLVCPRWSVAQRCQNASARPAVQCSWCPASLIPGYPA